MADDLTLRDIGGYDGQAHTPNIDKLAGQGIRMTRCFQAASMCSPTRHSIYTGLYPVKSGAYPNHTFVKDDVKSVIPYLKPLGYRVALSGKTHIGPKKVFPFEYSKKPGGPDMAAIDKLVGECLPSKTPFCLFVSPTICAATGAKPLEALHGKPAIPFAGTSLLPACKTGSMTARPIATEHQQARGYRMSDWKIVWGKRQPDSLTGNSTTSRPIDPSDTTSPPRNPNLPPNWPPHGKPGQNRWEFICKIAEISWQADYVSSKFADQSGSDERHDVVILPVSKERPGLLVAPRKPSKFRDRSGGR